MPSSLGVYLHFPWCRKLCPYCDFAVEVARRDDAIPHDAYLAAILAELEARAPRFAGELVSVYFGGGTPSLWRVDCIAAAIVAVRARFAARDAALEITLEANPSDCTPAQLAAWRAAGVTRVSIGVQSVDPRALIVLGRDHRHGDGPAALVAAKAAGLIVSADFIIGTPGASPVPPTAPEVDHVSVYELTIEARTRFGREVRAGTLTPLDEDTLATLYTQTHTALTAAGFEHYEISSYARPGRRAVHNALYWQGAAYLGLGVGAASLELLSGGGAIRATNPRRAADYLAAPGTPAERTEVGAGEMAADRAWLGMRTSDGVAAADLAPAVAAWLVDHALAEPRDGRICPTLRGFLFADQIAARIVQSDT